MPDMGASEAAIAAALIGAAASSGTALATMPDPVESSSESTSPTNDGSILDRVAAAKGPEMDLTGLMGQNRSPLFQSMMAQNSPFRFLG